MKKHQQITDGIGKFLDGKGFYVALAVCLAVIGGSTYYLVHGLRGLSSLMEESEPVSATVEIAAEELETPAVALPVEEAPEAEEVIAPVEEPVEAVAAPAEEPAAQTVQVTTWPIQGTVVTAFSPDVLLANETMGDWRTHQGIDLAAELGTNVQVVADGTVTDIQEDLLLGVVMTVSHGDGLTSSYGNLSQDLLVEVGDRVSAGCVLGQVGTTAAGESATGDHLHFSMELEGEPVNPRDYLP